MTYAAALLRETEPDDRAGLIALWMEVMATRSTTSIADWRYEWFFGENPEGAPTLCVTHHVESRSIVACGAAHPRLTQINGELKLAGNLSDFAVSKRHRTAGAALAVQRRLTNDALERFEFIYGCPNKEAEPIFKRLRFHIIGTTMSYVRPLRTADKLASMVPAQHRWLSDAASSVADRALAASDARVLWKRFAYRTSIIDRPDDRFDDLWKRARGHYGITGERSASYLTWRYTNFKTTKYRFFCLEHRLTKRLMGYVAFSVKDDVIIIEDMFCDHPKSRLDLMLLMFASEMRDGKNRSIWISLLAGAWYEKLLRRLLFVRRAEAKCLVVKEREGTAPALVSALKDPEQWFIVGGELDT